MVTCRVCHKVREREGVKGMQRRGWKLKTNRVKTRSNYPFGKKSRCIVSVVRCKNCGNTDTQGGFK